MRPAAKGCGYLDAPISGGVWGAEAGTLAIMVGGEAADFERGAPVFDAVGANIRHFGASGSGSVVKLCNNLIGAAVNAVISEAYVAAVKYGIDPAAMYETLQSATASSPRARAHGQGQRPGSGTSTPCLPWTCTPRTSSSPPTWAS